MSDVATSASTFTPQVDTIFYSLVGLSTLILFVIAAFVLYFLVKYRKRNPSQRNDPPTTNARLEIPIVAAFTIIMLGIFVWAGRAYFDLHTPPKGAMEIYVMSKQWMWKFEHSDGRVEVNEVHVPVNTDVKLILSSDDVIHSLYIPDFRIKQDALPGRFTVTWFNATKPGTSWLFCTQYCGTEHARMLANVVVMSAKDFLIWQQGSGYSAAASPKDFLLHRGSELFRSKGCNSCHSVATSENPASTPSIGPNLYGVFGREVELIDGRKIKADEEYLRESILEPNAKIVKGYAPQMPTFKGILSNEDLSALIHYLKSLRNPPAQGGSND